MDYFNCLQVLLILLIEIFELFFYAWRGMARRHYNNPKAWCWSVSTFFCYIELCLAATKTLITQFRLFLEV